MLPHCRTILCHGAFPVLLLSMGLAGCTKDNDQEQRQADASPDVVVGPLLLDAKADSANLPDASDATPAVDLAEADDAGAGIDSSSPLDTHVPLDGAAAVDTRIVCQMPDYSTNCMEVESFQCGFTPKCEDGVLSISWHEHACDGSSWVRSYSCTYTCPKGCNPNGIPWVSPGTKLIAEACNP
jgi:hypothetical protein